MEDNFCSLCAFAYQEDYTDISVNVDYAIKKNYVKYNDEDKNFLILLNGNVLLPDYFINEINKFKNTNERLYIFVFRYFRLLLEAKCYNPDYLLIIKDYLINITSCFFLHKTIIEYFFCNQTFRSDIVKMLSLSKDKTLVRVLDNIKTYYYHPPRILSVYSKNTVSTTAVLYNVLLKLNEKIE